MDATTRLGFEARLTSESPPHDRSDINPSFVLVLVLVLILISSSMSFSSPPPSPPPPMPSPVLVPKPLPSPPPFTKSTRRPQIPLSLNHALSRHVLHRAPSTPRFPHHAPKAENKRRPSSSPRTHSQPPSRCRSPPPSPAIRSPPPPVPPIPAFLLTTNHSVIRPPRRPSAPNHVSAFDLYLDHPRVPPNMCCESQAGGALTCVQFFAVHDPTGQCHS